MKDSGGGFDLEGFVAEARAAARATNPLRACIDLMDHALAEAAAGGPIHLPENETLLFEDDTVSVWHERFLPTEELPPHDHAMPAILGVYAGREANRLWWREGGWRPGGTLILEAGEFHVFGPSDIHSVRALDDAPSHGLHIYLGPLTRMARSLFDWEDGARTPLCGEAFEGMVRSLDG